MSDAATDPRALLGEWEFDRVVDDHLADERIGVVGTAEFTLEDDGAVRWAEQGVSELIWGVPDKSEDEVLTYLDKLAGRLQLSPA